MMKQDEILDVGPERKGKFDAMHSAEDARRAADAEAYRAYRRQYYQAHKEAFRAYQRQYYQAHKAEIDARHAAWRARNPEKHASYAKAWRDQNPEMHMQHRIRAAIRFLEKHGYTVTK